MKKLLLVFLLTLTGCGKLNKDYGVFNPLMEQFVIDAATYGRTIEYKEELDVQLDVLEYPTIGYCLLGHMVRIDRDYWEAYPANRKVLLYHELGHCVLGRWHRDDVSSIMNSQLINGQYVNANLDYFLEELFTYYGEY